MQINICYLGKRKTKAQRPYWGICPDFAHNQAFVYIWRFVIILPFYRTWPHV